LLNQARVNDVSASQDYDKGAMTLGANVAAE
jgi:hypothetical protein